MRRKRLAADQRNTLGDPAQMQRLRVAGDDLDQEIVVDRQQKYLRTGAHFDRRVDVARKPEQRRRRKRNFGPLP